MLASAPIIVAFWCFYKMQMKELDQTSSVNRIPMARSVFRALKSQNYGQTNKMSETCIICMEAFKKQEKVKSLHCDERHVFHSKCLEKWLCEKLECPICKAPVSKPGTTD
jgi:hypothetical protein